MRYTFPEATLGNVGAEHCSALIDQRNRLRFSGLDAPGAKNDSVPAFYELPELFAIGNREQCRISSEGHNILFPYITKNCFQKGLLQVEGRPSRRSALSFPSLSFDFVATSHMLYAALPIPALCSSTLYLLLNLILKPEFDQPLFHNRTWFSSSTAPQTFFCISH